MHVNLIGSQCCFNYDTMKTSLLEHLLPSHWPVILTLCKISAQWAVQFPFDAISSKGHGKLKPETGHYE